MSESENRKQATLLLCQAIRLVGHDTIRRMVDKDEEDERSLFEAFVAARQGNDEPMRRWFEARRNV
jgi:hypothetical protein